jgi:hypothetical protein
MRTYEDSFVLEVLTRFSEIVISPHDYCGGQRGGVPDIFYDTSQAIAAIKTKRSLKDLTSKGEKVEADEIEHRYLSLYSIYTDELSIKFELRKLRKQIDLANKDFDKLLRAYISAKKPEDIKLVCDKAMVDLKEAICRGGNSPRDWFFIRRFGIYG